MSWDPLVRTNNSSALKVLDCIMIEVHAGAS